MSYSPAVQAVVDQLTCRLRSGHAAVGSPFMSARAVSERYAISYQTAHRVLSGLMREGLVVRRGRRGTFVGGGRPALVAVGLWMNRRASNAQGFGGKLSSALRGAFAEASIECRLRIDESHELAADELPVIWEQPAVVERCLAEGRPAVVVNDRVRPGWDSGGIDSVGADDFAGGALAADVLWRCVGRWSGMVVLAGPAGDRRSDERVAGFRTRGRARVVHADNWFRDAGRRVGPAVMGRGALGVFAANDRLAQGFLMACRDAGVSPPAVMGYDDAPIAERLGISTVALPWGALASLVVARARLRMSGVPSPACTVLLQPSAVLRRTCTRQ